MAQVTDVLSYPTGESRYANMLQISQVLNKLLSAADEVTAVRRLLAKDRDAVNRKDEVGGWR